MGSSLPVSWGSYQEDGVKFFTVRHNRRMRGSRHNLKEVQTEYNEFFFPSENS